MKNNICGFAFEKEAKDENLLEGPIHITSINAMKMLEQRIDAQSTASYQLAEAYQEFWW